MGFKCWKERNKNFGFFLRVVRQYIFEIEENQLKDNLN